MNITERQWSEGDWTWRLNILKKKLGLEQDQDLAKYLGVTQKSLYYWRTGQRVPRPEKELAIRRIVIPRDAPRDLDDKFVGATTIGFDVATQMFKRALETRDPVTLSLAVHSICLKIAQLLSAKKDITYVSYLSSLFGSNPAKETIAVTVPGAEAFACNIMVTHTTSGDMTFVVRTSLLLNGQVERQFAFTVNDAGIAETVKRIHTYTTLKFFK